jgi:hypothetical protein
MRRRRWVGRASQAPSSAGGACNRLRGLRRASSLPPPPPQVGSAQNWVFKATTSRTKSGFAAVKIFCLPIPKMGKKPYQ